VQGAAPPKSGSWLAYPMAGYASKYAISAEAMARSEPAADDSFAAILACSRLGIAMAAITRMIAITIINSISEKPLNPRIVVAQPFRKQKTIPP
jgi:hypothetical protein